MNVDIVVVITRRLLDMDECGDSPEEIYQVMEEAGKKLLKREEHICNDYKYNGKSIFEDIFNHLVDLVNLVRLMDEYTKKWGF